MSEPHTRELMLKSLYMYMYASYIILHLDLHLDFYLDAYLEIPILIDSFMLIMAQKIILVDLWTLKLKTKLF